MFNIKRRNQLFVAGRKRWRCFEAESQYDTEMVFMEKDEHGTSYVLYNEFGELCCLDGEECMIDHLVAGTEDIYDLRNDNGETTVHFMLSEDDLGIATFKS